MTAAARLLACLAVAFFGTCAYSADAVPADKPDLAKGATISANVCVACHANDGSRGSPANPILQGQHPDYLVKQLTEFKAGKRDNPIMKGIASTLSDADMKNVAAFYASKDVKPGFARNKDLAALGREDLSRRSRRPKRARMRRLPWPDRRRDSSAVPAAVSSARRIRGSAAPCLSRWRAAQQRADDGHCLEAERPRDQGACGLRCRPALIGGC